MAQWVNRLHLSLVFSAKAYYCKMVFKSAKNSEAMAIPTIKCYRTWYKSKQTRVIKNIKFKVSRDQFLRKQGISKRTLKI